jgi:hypothetical protein
MKKLFVHYKDDGEIYCLTLEDTAFFEERLARGEKVVEIDQQIDPKSYHLDLTTMKPVLKETPAPEPVQTPPLDIESAKQYALQIIDSFSCIAGSSLTPIYQAKLRQASAVIGELAELPPEFIEEAKLRNIGPIDLCNLIIQRDTEQHYRLIELDYRRQVARAAVNAATSQQEIDAAVETFRISNG